MVTFNISNRSTYTVLAIFIVIALVGLAIAAPIVNNPNPGHDGSEIEFTQGLNVDGNHLYIKNSGAPSGARTWGIVISGSNGQFNIGQSGSNAFPVGGSLSTSPFIIMRNAPSSTLVLRSDGKINATLLDHQSGGLYGLCTLRYFSNPDRSICGSTIKSPATCNQVSGFVSECNCPSGYLSVSLDGGSAGSFAKGTTFACYKN